MCQSYKDSVKYLAGGGQPRLGKRFSSTSGAQDETAGTYPFEVPPAEQVFLIVFFIRLSVLSHHYESRFLLQSKSSSHTHPWIGHRLSWTPSLLLMENVENYTQYF